MFPNGQDFNSFGLYKAWSSKEKTDEEGKAPESGPPAVSQKMWIGAAITTLVILWLLFFI